MSARLAKKKVQKHHLLVQQENQINSVFSIYDNQLDYLYRQLARKTDSIEWVEQSYSYLPFNKTSNIEILDAWLIPADNSRKKTLKTDVTGTLRIDLDLAKGDSFYLQTGSMNIDGLPVNKQDWCIQGGHKYRVHIDAQYAEQRPDCALFFLQYDNEKRIAHKFQQIYNGLNKIEFETEKDARYFSIAFRFKGQGSLIIKPLKSCQIIIKTSINNCEKVDTGIKRKILSYDEKLMLIQVHFKKGGIVAVHNHHHSKSTFIS